MSYLDSMLSKYYEIYNDEKYKDIHCTHVRIRLITAGANNKIQS